MASLIKRSGKWLSKPFLDPVSGKRKTAQFDTQALALAYEEACADAARAGLPYLPRPASVTAERTLHAIVVKTLSTRYAVSSQNTKDTMANLFAVITREFGTFTPAADVLDKDRLTAWVAGLTDKAPATRNLYRVALSALAATAAEASLVPIFKLRNEKVQNGRDKYLTADEEDRLLIHLRDDIKTLTRFMLLTGLRISEALSVSPSDARDGVLTCIRKGNKLGRIPLTDEAVSLLEASGGWSHLSATTVQGHFRTATRKAKITGVTPHTLRHTTASRLAQRGIGMLQLQQFMDHASLTTTQRYAHLAPDWGEGVKNLLDDC